ncbi:glycosyltransferase involved in cell wall biosynthesis [Maritimibacter alkaliphilus HTCC2654]|uniref:Probable glycosyl transferase protein n=1 Tax=Maritimibacter alkaliphilus HTCC2654 TaxID=314271 RepID=A3VCG6_9RHOB|nr:glycosyltransferase family 2 protein [Maritimibacter alkaliphilus]EAQ13832.1 probable glycosyl transferase protein [Maritimibacter alkaliphilus HTCC2654]TYP84029.1 glycosyltransferase involved in cell wall biosynthesis [Maritimibacter alkaliphilus HTCC2654]
MPDQTRPKLGVVTISYNEERDLPGFLANLIDWVDEIIIVDDGSSDTTEDLAKAAGPKVRFLRSPRVEGEYFSHQRNKGIDAATSDWLLHMDVDERVTPELARQVQEAICDDGKDGYRYRRLNYFMHRPMKGGGWRDWNLVHLARRDKFRFGGMFHEDCLLDAPESRVGQLSALMVHFNEDNLEKRFRKSGQYMEEVVKGVEGRGRPVRFIDIAGRPIYEFFRKYVAKKGFQDGIPGFISAVHSATAIFRANAIVWDRQNAITRSQIDADFQDQWTRGGGAG